eukprot:2357709-Rhodomonas_salina.2
MPLSVSSEIDQMQKSYGLGRGDGAQSRLGSEVDQMQQCTGLGRGDGAQLGSEIDHIQKSIVKCMTNRGQILHWNYTEARKARLHCSKGHNATLLYPKDKIPTHQIDPR